MLQKKQEENEFLEMIDIENSYFISSYKKYPFVEMSEILKQALKLYDVKSTEFAIRRDNAINSGIRFIYKTDWSHCDSLESNNKICVRQYKKREIKEIIEEKEKLLEIINLSNYEIYEKLVNAGMSEELADLIAYNEKFLPCQTTIYRVLIILKVNLNQFDEIFKIHEYTRLCQNGMYYFIRMCIEKEIYDLDFINSQIFHHTKYHLI